MAYACARASTWVHAGCDPGEGLGPRAQVGPPIRRKGERGVCGWVTGGVSGRFLPSNGFRCLSEAGSEVSS